MPPDSLYCNGCGASIGVGEQSREATSLSAQPPPSPLAASEARAVSKSQQSDQVIFRIRPAFYSVGLAYAIAVLFSLAAAAAIGMLSGPPWAMFVFAAVFFTFPIYRHIQRNRVIYTLTTAKIEIEYGLLSKTIRNIPLRNIQDVTTSVTLGERLLGVGDVIIDSAAEAGKIPMKNIKHPRKHADLILDQLQRWH